MALIQYGVQILPGTLVRLIEPVLELIIDMRIHGLTSATESPSSSMILDWAGDEYDIFEVWHCYQSNSRN